MAFTDALDLRTAVVEAVGDASISDVWPRLVSMAESKLDRVLRTRYQVQSADVTGLPGSSVFPGDFLEMTAMYKAGRRVLWTPGMQTPNEAFSMEYYARIPSLSNDLAGTNWLLTVYPDVYLYAVAVEAARFLKDVAAAQAYGEALQEALRSVYVDDERARYGQAVVRMPGWTP